MMESESNPIVAMSLQADKNVISSQSPQTRILEITIIPPVKTTVHERASLNLSLVLDRSGSMSGEKLEYVKQAASHLLDLLEPSDQAAVIIYDDAVNTLIPLHWVTDSFRADAKEKIRQVRTGGSTFLSGGWLRGCEEIAPGISESSINRTLLLTDGLANKGIVDLEELATHAREIYQRGIATTCFGVGHGYNEHLLEAMSNAGGGNFHYLETLNAIPLEFEREFEELISVTLRDTELSLDLPEHVNATVSAGYDARTTDNRMTIALGSLYSGKEKRIYVTLKFDHALSGETVCIKATVRGKGAGGFLCEDEKLLTIKVVSDEEEHKAAADQALLERFAVVDLADQANEALKRERAGDRAGANRILNQSLSAHSANIPASMRSKFKFMADQMSSGLDESARKRYHQEEYFNRRGRDFIRDYPLNLVNGHLIARIENATVLIDTGLPISMGTMGTWYFLNQVHELSPSYMGVSPEYISRMVGTRVDIILGSDIIRNLDVLIELDKERITFCTGYLRGTREEIPLADFMGIPITTVTIGDTLCDAFIDTGARLSYVDSTLISSLSPIGIEKDFYPGMGEFETQVFQVPVQIGHQKFSLRCGVLPVLLEKALFVTEKRGIIGAELFKKFQVHLAFILQSMSLN